MSTLSTIEVFYVVLCGLGFVALCAGVYVAEARLTTALRYLKKHPQDLEMQARARLASDGVRSSLAKSTAMISYLAIGLSASFGPEMPPSPHPVPFLAAIVPVLLIIAPTALAIDAYLEWRSSATLAALIRAMKAEMEVKPKAEQDEK